MAWLGVVLCGCGGDPVFALGPERACEHDVLPFDLGLVRYLDDDVDGDGAFDRSVPDAPLIASVRGNYNLTSGLFDYTETFVDGHYRTQRVVQGQGTVFPNGDTDLTLQVVDTLTNGTELGNLLRLQRTGCEVERYWQNFDGRVLVAEQGTITATGFVYTRTSVDGGVEKVTEGVRTAGGDWSETLAYLLEDGTIYSHEEEGSAAGVVARELTQASDDWTAAGTVTLNPDGERRFEMSVQEDGVQIDWDYSIDLDGDGDGDAAINNGFVSAPCEVSFDDFDCESACDEECPRRRGGWATEPPRGPLGHR